MCEAHVYVSRDGNLEEFMKNVVSITPQDDERLLLIDLFGERKLVDAKLVDIRLLDHKVIIEER